MPCKQSLFRREEKERESEAWWLHLACKGVAVSGGPNTINQARKIIPQLRKSEVKKLGNLALEDLYKDNNIPLRALHTIIDLCKAKLNNYMSSHAAAKNIKDKVPCIIRYVNHGIGRLNLGSIFRKKEVIGTLPLPMLKHKDPMVVYKYTPTIRSKIFNYRQTAEEYIEDSEIEMNCDCSSSRFVDSHHGHVITGDLNIIESAQLRNIFQKGPGYRERRCINWKIAEKSVLEDLDEFINKWGSKNGVTNKCFSEWKCKVTNMIKEKVKRLRKVSKYEKVSSIFNVCAKELEDLKLKYVLVPVDKASNNIGFICKKYYLQVLKEEITSGTYEIYRNTPEEVKEYLKKEMIKIAMPVGKPFIDLPLIHMTLKMHKNPIKFRFIIGSRTAIVKPAAKYLVQILKLVMDVHRRYCAKVKFFTGIDRYWIIDNNQPLLEMMEQINCKRKARSFEGFDFSTLYTKISPEDLKDKLKSVVDKAFKGGTNQYIRVTDSSARWCKDTRGKGRVFTKEHIFLLIDFIVDNSFFRFGNVVYRQCIGIPMGVDPAPQMANLYLYYYESTFMEKLAKSDYKTALKFNNTTRFIDDLGTLNNDGVLAAKKEDVYPAEMELLPQNQDPMKGTMLDISIMVINGKFVTKTYDKRDDYNFDIVNYPDLSGNIPPGAAYGVYISQVLRYARVCSEKKDFDERVEILTRKLTRKGYTKEKLQTTLMKCYQKHKWIPVKYKL